MCKALGGVQGRKHGGPNGAHGCEDRLPRILSLLSHHPAICCQISISHVKRYSSSIAKVLTRFVLFLTNLSTYQ